MEKCEVDSCGLGHRPVVWPCKQDKDFWAMQTAGHFCPCEEPLATHTISTIWLS